MITFGPLKQNLQVSSFKMKLLTVSILSTCTFSLFMTTAHANTELEAQKEEQALVTTAVKAEPSVDAFMKCADLKMGAARLACYDKVTFGEDVSVGREKKPLDLTESFKASFNDFRPKAVYADSGIEADTHDANTTVANNEKLEKAGITVDDFAPYTMLSLAYDLDKNSENGTWTVRPHNPIYLMPVYAHYDPNLKPQTPNQKPTDEQFAEYADKYDDSVELKAQVSLKTKIAEDVFDTHADVWFGYTQQMHWQVYNEDNSRPFRATDYMPEVFITQPVKANLPFNGRLRMLGAGAIHHSNGQSDPWSRSWNRIYLMGGAEWGKLTLVPKVWTHVKNETDSNPSDNPDITDYYGHGELLAFYDFGKGETLSATGRYNFDTEKGSIQVDYTQPLTRDLRAFIQIFHGYGESIIDYNDETTSVGVGLSLNDWKGL